jgi:hypothetical protein
MEDLNNEGLTPKDIEKMVKKQRERIDEENKNKEPSVEQVPTSGPAPSTATSAPATAP